MALDHIYLFVLPNQLFETTHLKNAFNFLSTSLKNSKDRGIEETYIEKKDINIKNTIHTENVEITVVLWEHPHFFTRFKFNKKKLVLHRASMKHYYDTVLEDLEKNGVIHKRIYVDYIDSHIGRSMLKQRAHKGGAKTKKRKTKKATKKVAQVENHIVAFDPIDKVTGFNRHLEIMVESPNFLLTKKDYTDYRKGRKADKGFAFTTGFYVYGKKIVNILEKVKSTDHANRSHLKSHDDLSQVPVVPSAATATPRGEQNYIDEARKYVDAHFPKNYGTTDGFHFPISHPTARKWMKDFVTHRFEHFGMYQDAIVKDNYALYHSLLSSSLNIGLLNPIDILDTIAPLNPDTNKKSTIPLNSFEGYVRQLFWREYQRYCYIHAYHLIKKTNYFNHHRRITKKWYNGKTGVAPVDNCINRAFETAYLHHIERLMVIGNFMMLNKISPTQGYKWFMEFSIDSYDWVMHQNVYDMVFFNSGGITMRKPYISSSNYIMKMSNYPRTITTYTTTDDTTTADTKTSSKGRKGNKARLKARIEDKNRLDWTKTWDILYHDFLMTHREKLKPFIYHFPGLRKKTSTG